jgi:hypothetical protein
VGKLITLFDGTRWRLYSTAEISLALSGLTSGKNYDVFAYDNAGTVTLELSAAWTNDTTRADALALQDGVLREVGATTLRRYLGTLHASGANTTEDSGGGSTTQVGGKRFVWNRYNRVARDLALVDKTDSWDYSTATVRQANGASGNKVEWVTGDALTLVDVRIVVSVFLPSGTNVGGYVGVGIDGTTAFAGRLNQLAFSSDATIGSIGPCNGFYRGRPGLGYHYASWLESGNGNATVTWLGDNGTTAGVGNQSGMEAWMEN